jgi:hypothetical protein
MRWRRAVQGVVSSALALRCIHIVRKPLHINHTLHSSNAATPTVALAENISSAKYIHINPAPLVRKSATPPHNDITRGIDLIASFNLCPCRAFEPAKPVALELGFRRVKGGRGTTGVVVQRPRQHDAVQRPEKSYIIPAPPQPHALEPSHSLSECASHTQWVSLRPEQRSVIAAFPNPPLRHARPPKRLDSSSILTGSPGFGTKRTLRRATIASGSDLVRTPRFNGALCLTSA